ncbi:hypothetical protein [Streptosporangium roseum]|uniref:hypothetical protein n=1 Tax=Streptosporangium roseum TaxID=2001 RepID=UPI0033288417
MTRRSWMLWAGAVLAALLGTIASDLAEMAMGRSGFTPPPTIPDSCPGTEFDDAYGDPFRRAVKEVPLFWARSTPFVLLVLVLWWIGVHRGRPRLGPAAARAAAVLILLATCFRLPLIALDWWVDPGCVEFWGTVRRGEIARGLCTAVSLAFMLRAASAVPGIPAAPFRRRKGHGRRALSAVLAMGLLLSADTVPQWTTPSGHEICRDGGVLNASVSTSGDRVLSFLCAVRKNRAMPVGLTAMSDRELLGYVLREVCGVIVRDDRGEIRRFLDGTGIDVTAIDDPAYVCPDVRRKEKADERRAVAEYRRKIAALRERCARRTASGGRPVRRTTKMIYTQHGVIEGGEEGGRGPAKIVADLVEVAPGSLVIMTGAEEGHACVTFEAYRERPSPRTRGWEQVVEVGYRSPAGSLAFGDGGDIDRREFGGFSLAGKGSYRVRIHVRGRDRAREEIGPSEGTEEYLIMIYPGTGGKAVVQRG